MSTGANKMELMDWKQIESSAEEQIISGENAIVIAGILLREAKKQIKKLNGQTNEEINKEAKKKRENIGNDIEGWDPNKEYGPPLSVG